MRVTKTCVSCTKTFVRLATNEHQAQNPLWHPLCHKCFQAQERAKAIEVRRKLVEEQRKLVEEQRKRDEYLQRLREEEEAEAIRILNERATSLEKMFNKEPKAFFEMIAKFFIESEQKNDDIAETFETLNEKIEQINDEIESLKEKIEGFISKLSGAFSS